MMWYAGDGWGWISWILMAVGMVVFWAAVIAAVVLVVHYLAGQRGRAASPPISSPRAEDVLAERFGRGEIDDEEYRHRLALLREHGG
ncbi:MAG: SHOCT domain-containing protein [Mycobacterium sp.]